METPSHIKSILYMKRNPLQNYIVPGLTSWLLADLKEKGMIRLFEMERHQEMAIAPHSHRFDFDCIVLAGSVVNTLWRPSYNIKNGDEFQITSLEYMGQPGQYKETRGGIMNYTPLVQEHKEGDKYGMRFDEIHSIKFSRGAKVLFFEGPSKTTHTTLLDPYVNGQRVPQSAIQPWMFHKTVNLDDHFV